MKENNENEWGDLECLYKACQAAKLKEAFSQTLAWVNEVRINE